MDKDEKTTRCYGLLPILVPFVIILIYAGFSFPEYISTRRDIANDTNIVLNHLKELAGEEHDIVIVNTIHTREGSINIAGRADTTTTRFTLYSEQLDIERMHITVLSDTGLISFCRIRISERNIVSCEEFFSNLVE